MPPACKSPLGALCLLAAAAWAQGSAEIRALQRQGDLAGALQQAERAAAARPRDAEPRFLRGVILMDLQRDAEAAAEFEALTQEFPELAEPWNNLALLHARAGRLPQALAALETALRNQPGNTTARRNLGDVHLRLAIQAWETAASAVPDDMDLRQRLRLARELASRPR